MNVASIILCAGVGSRLKSSKNKILHEVGGRPLGYWPIRNAMAATNLKPIVVLSHQAVQVEEVLRRYFGDKIDFAYQPEPNGTAGAVKAALSHLDPSCDSVLVVCGDTPLLKKDSLTKLVAIQRNSHAPVALMSAIAEEPAGYGRVLRNSTQQICGIVEDSDASPREREITEVNAGVYVFDAAFLRENIHKIEPNNRKKEYYLTDLVHLYIKHDPNLGPVGNVEIPYEEMHGINDRRQLAFAQRVLNRRLLDHWMLEGITIIDPNSTYIEESVRLDRDVIIYPGVHLRGKTKVAEGVIIENGSIISDTIIEKGAHILPYTWCDHAFIGEGSQVGPFARLRPDSHLESNVKVGNFVEVKKSRLKTGAKAGHLAYIGDAEVGERANIGAGTITCNYDGFKKHKTQILNDAFIGSNSTLIAPLSIGEHSYVAGGSVITSDVPDKTLAIGRAPQVNKVRNKHAREKKNQTQKNVESVVTPVD